MEVDVFDFDKTVYPGDSAVDFYFFVLGRKPYLLFLLPKVILGFLLAAVGIFPLKRAKAWFFSFMRYIDGESMVSEFWAKNEGKLHPWFAPDFFPRDAIVISASPQFLVHGVSLRRGAADALGTLADIHTGRISGENCKGEEKLRRLRETRGEVTIVRAYSDSVRADGPMLRAAREAFIVKNGVFSPFAEGG